MIVLGDLALEFMDNFEGSGEHANRIAACKEMVEAMESDQLLKRAATILQQVCVATWLCICFERSPQVLTHCTTRQVWCVWYPTSSWRTKLLDNF
jgi:hypothetical protein